METYIGLLCMIGVVGGTITVMMLLQAWLGPKYKSEVHNRTYECGLNPRKVTRGNFSVKFFLAALLFILFDIELIFLFPWAVAYRDLGLFGFVEMFIFLLVVASGLFYVVKKGALDWK